MGGCDHFFKNMKILYIANVRMPTEKAHGVQIMSMCESFAHVGADVELIVPTRKTAITDDPFAYYGLQKNFKLTFLYVPDTVSWGKVGFLFQHVFFSVRAVLYMWQVKGVDIIYSRDPLVLGLLGSHRKVAVWEVHDGSKSLVLRWCARRISKIVAISEGLRMYWSGQGINRDNIIVAPDGVDLKQFEYPESKESARARLGLRVDKKIALYIGRLDGWKGVNTLCETVQYLSPNIQVVIIGGEPEQVMKFKEKYPTVTFLGYHPYRELADNQVTADVLVLPNTGKSETAAKFTSPLKLFTYMVSGVPIVATDLPSTREILDDTLAYFVPSDDAEAMAKGIEEALSDPEASAKAVRAQAKVKDYTWDARARSIIGFAQR